MHHQLFEMQIEVLIEIWQMGVRLLNVTLALRVKDATFVLNYIPCIHVYYVYITYILRTIYKK